MIIEGYVEGV